MTDEELQRVIAEIDSALEVLRKTPGELDAGDARIRAALADLRRELAVYRALSQAQENSRRD